MIFSGKNWNKNIYIILFAPSLKNVLVYIKKLRLTKVFSGNSIKARGVDLERHTGGCGGGEFREVRI